MPRNNETYPTPQQALLDVAVARWGPQFSEDNGSQKWHTFTEIGGLSSGTYAGVTDGRDYYIVDEATGYFREILVSTNKQDALAGGYFTMERDADGKPRYSIIL
jgi:hypothetical protein